MAPSRFLCHLSVILYALVKEEDVVMWYVHVQGRDGDRGVVVDIGGDGDVVIPGCGDEMVVILVML